MAKRNDFPPRNTETSLTPGESHTETPAEFSYRMQTQLDRDQWQGIDYVACDYPEPAEVIVIDPPETQVIFKRRDAF